LTTSTTPHWPASLGRAASPLTWSPGSPPSLVSTAAPWSFRALRAPQHPLTSEPPRAPPSLPSCSSYTYLAPLHIRIPQGLKLSYVDDFALTAPSLSYRENIRHLQKLFRTIKVRADRLGISFSLSKTELIHWRTPSQRHTQTCLVPILLDGELFHPRDSLRWLGSLFTPTLSASTHFSCQLVLARGAFALIRHLSPPGAGLAPYLCHRLATSLVALILLWGADLFTPNTGSLWRLNTFWHKVQRWATNCFSSTPISMLAIETCLPPIPLLVSHRQRLAALPTVCSPPEVNPGTAGLHPSFPSLSSHRAPDSSRTVPTGLSSVYRPLR